MAADVAVEWTSSVRPRSSIPQCCCGRSQADCPFFAHNNTLLDGLERDVQTAARLGQALLLRHEAYIADAQHERNRMAADIERLETEKLELETKNAKIVEENRELLDQLEGLNNTVAESDSQVQSLTATLHSTQLELQRLMVLASRTEQLERQLSQLEKDQAELHATLESTEQDEKTAVNRWRQAERTIADLQDQVDRIEQEAREERERHVQVVGRMERRLAVEKELRTTAGRLTGTAAAAEKRPDQGNGTSVVSHFVKDILQDNANLQMGIVELREMLQTSNEEVEKLREQLQLHQPLRQDVHDGWRNPTLRTELARDTVRQFSQELHVHHHYHAPTETPAAGSRTGTQVQRRAKKKRTVVTPGHFTPPVGNAIRTPSESNTPMPPSSATAILSHTSASIPQQTPTRNRWSTLSNNTTLSMMGSSVPSSPYTPSNRTSSIFSRVFSDTAMESDRPTSPESNDPGSPQLLPASARPHADFAVRSFSTPAPFQLKSKPSAPALIGPDITIPEHPVADEPDATEPSIDSSSTLQTSATERDETSSATSIIDNDDTCPSLPLPFLRRAASHESLLSVSGMDIHTLRHRPSQLLTLSLSNSTSPVVSQTTAVASRPSLLAGSSPSISRSLLSGIAAEQRAAAAPGALLFAGVGAGAGAGQARRNLGQRVGGWVLGKWGVTLAAAAVVPASVHSSTAAAGRGARPVPERPPPSPQKPKAVPPKKLRPPGVNQDGPILWDLQPVPESGPGQGKAPGVLVGEVDEDALRESLCES